ncbi:hypothetical protein K438DRAFT_1986564 [Mycena galopus ATCC 62051]|nr:hypothetical protein K438DRAFT_1986564 [Mycena galopus ATCC 62051]
MRHVDARSREAHPRCQAGSRVRTRRLRTPAQAPVNKCRVRAPYLACVDLADVGFAILSWTSNGDRCILDDRATSWEPSVIVEGAWVHMTPSLMTLLDSHHYLEPPAHAFAAHSILPSSCVFRGAGAFRTTHMKLATLLASVSTLKSRSPPKFHSPDIPLDAEALHGAAP